MCLLQACTKPSHATILTSTECMPSKPTMKRHSRTLRATSNIRRDRPVTQVLLDEHVGWVFERVLTERGYRPSRGVRGGRTGRRATGLKNSSGSVTKGATRQMRPPSSPDLQRRDGLELSVSALRVTDTASYPSGPEPSDRHLGDIVVIIIGVDEEHPIDVCCGPESEGIAKRRSVAKYEVSC